MDVDTKMDRQVEVAQAALLARYAPDTCIRRVHWSQGETQVLELGNGSALLLAHGGLSSVFEWVLILPTLAHDHRVITIGRPGHGLAEPFDYTDVDLLDHARTFLRNILGALEVYTVDVAANSIGGLWTVLFAIDAPGRVSWFALVGTSAGMRRIVPFRLRALGLPLIAQLFLHAVYNRTKLIFARSSSDFARRSRPTQSTLGFFSFPARLTHIRRKIVENAVFSIDCGLLLSFLHLLYPAEFALE